MVKRRTTQVELRLPTSIQLQGGLRLDFEPVDRRAPGEVTKEVIDRQFWSEDWEIQRVSAYLATVVPNYRAKAGGKCDEVEKLLGELEAAMGGAEAKRNVSFPVVLILATKDLK
jgi:hypothetical protein